MRSLNLSSVEWKRGWIFVDDIVQNLSRENILRNTSLPLAFSLSPFIRLFLFLFFTRSGRNVSAYKPCIIVFYIGRRRRLAA